MVELLNHIARLWWAWTVSMFWQVGLLILVIACIDLLIRKWAWPQLRYALWSLILVKLILPPTLSLPSGIIPELGPRVAQALRWMDSDRPAADERSAVISNLESQISSLNLSVVPQFRGFAIPGADRAISVRSVPEGAFVETQNLASPYAIATNEASAQSAALPSSVLRSLSSVPLIWQFYAMMIWLFGTLILGIWLVLRLHSVAGRHAYRAAAASLPQSFYNHLAGCATRLGLRRIPRVVVTKRLTSPAVFGVFRPVLLMPKGYLSKLSRRDTEHMLLHELAHIKRGDLVMHSLYMLLQIVYWYNPLLWLVRRHLHHLRELSCDGTVAELLRERTLAYRQTLLETARRLLTTSVEPGLGLLGLFEDSNHLLVRLNWLTKPTWRYRTMKRAIVATLALLMFTCVLPMAQGQESASKEPSPTVVKEQDQSSQDQLSQDVAKLQAQLEQLMAQQQELQKQLRTLSARRNQVGGQEQPVERRGPVPVARPRRERAPAELPVAPVPGAPPVAAPRSAREAPDREAQEQIREVQRQIQRAQDEAKQAMKEAAKAHAEHVPHAQNDQDWAKSMDAYSEQMEKWGQKMERWGQEFGRRQAAAVSGSLSDSEARERPPMPVMPPMPAMPAMPPMPPVPVAVPEIHVPPIEPPVPPPVPQRQENQEEVVSRTEHTVDLAPGRLLDVKNEMGSIAVRGSNEPGCKLTITVKGRAGTKEEAQALVDQVKPVIRLSQDGVSVAMTKPEKEVNREHANRVVTMELVVPRDAQLRLSQAFGDIRLTGLNGSVRAISNMGTIRASDVRGRVVLESNFGSIDFLAPKGFSAKVQAKSQMGSIQSDLPLEVVKPAGVSMGSRASGTVGSGEGDVSLTTNMGSIRIRSEEAGPRRAERSRSEARPRPEPRPRPQRQSQEEF